MLRQVRDRIPLTACQKSSLQHEVVKGSIRHLRQQYEKNASRVRPCCVASGMLQRAEMDIGQVCEIVMINSLGCEKGQANTGRTGSEGGHNTRSITVAILAQGVWTVPSFISPPTPRDLEREVLTVSLHCSVSRRRLRSSPTSSASPPHVISDLT